MSNEKTDVFSRQIPVEWLSQKSVTDLIFALGPLRSQLCPKEDEQKIRLKIRFENVSRDPFDKNVFGYVVISSLRRTKTQKAAEQVKELISTMVANEMAAERQALLQRPDKDAWNPPKGSV